LVDFKDELIRSQIQGFAVDFVYYFRPVDPGECIFVLGTDFASQAQACITVITVLFTGLKF
jgi:hypothetical protein